MKNISGYRDFGLLSVFLAVCLVVLAVVYAVLNGPAGHTGDSRVLPAQTACAGSLDIVAHEDDDILFMNPDIQKDISAGRCVTTVYLTVGDYGRGWQITKFREDGAKAAYAHMAGVPDNWTEDNRQINSRSLVAFSLDGKPNINLIFLRLPNTGGSVKGWPFYGYQSLAELYDHQINKINPVDGAPGYTLNQLVSTLRKLIGEFRPEIIRVQDYKAQLDGSDHSDHIFTAKIALMANRGFSYAHTVIGYYDYQTSQFPANLSAVQIEAKQNIWLAYAPFDPSACQSIDKCKKNTYGAWLKRQYIAGVLTSP